MDSGIRNKQVNMDKIYELAKLFESYAEDFNQKGKEEDKIREQLEADYKAEKITYSELSEKERQSEYNYEGVRADVKYDVGYYDGTSYEEEGFDWFLEHTEQPKNIKSIYISLSISLRSKHAGTDRYDYKSLSANARLSDNDIYNNGTTFDVRVDSDKMDDLNTKLHNEILKIFESCPPRLDKTIANRGIRKQAFSIAVGIVLSYILYLILRICSSSIPEFFNQALLNKNVIIFGQWFASVVLGNVCALWAMEAIYKPIVPYRKYVGYNKSSRNSIYKDDLQDYKECSEVRFGRLYDSQKRRDLIEKLYKYGLIVIGVQILISGLLYLILK